MLKLLITVPLVLFLVSNAWPQEESPGSEAAAAQVAEAAADVGPGEHENDTDGRAVDEAEQVEIHLFIQSVRVTKRPPLRRRTRTVSSSLPRRTTLVPR